MSNNRSYTSWDVNDLAFLLYADYKGIPRKLVGEMFDVSDASISQQMMKIRNPESYSQKTQTKINKAQVLEMKVRGGKYPDHRKLWDERLTRVTGIQYSYPPEQKGEEKPQETVTESSETTGHPPLLQITVSTEAVLTIIKAWGRVK